MPAKIHSIAKKSQYDSAGSTDLIELLPIENQTQLYVQKCILESIVWAILNCEFIHLSGPTGTAKTSLIEALSYEPKNFDCVCNGMAISKDTSLRRRVLRLYPIEMAIFDSPGELFQRRALKDGVTYDEPSLLVEAIKSANKHRETELPLIWLREIGRTHSAGVQSGLLNLMTRGKIQIPGEEPITGAGIAYIADSNYAAARESEHTLVSFDDALKRRFTTNITLDYLDPNQEVMALRTILALDKEDHEIWDLSEKIVRLGVKLRQHRQEGRLRSTTPPSIPGYMTFIRMARELPHLTWNQIGAVTLLGNAGNEDYDTLRSVFSEVFGSEDSQSVESQVSNLF